jgi:hypothetical protein
MALGNSHKTDLFLGAERRSISMQMGEAASGTSVVGVPGGLLHLRELILEAAN